MTAAGRAKRPAAVTAPAPRYEIGDPVPAYVRNGLRKHPVAWSNFRALAPGYRRDYVRFITEAKRPETRARRLEQAIRRLKDNRKQPADITREAKGRA